MNDNAVAAVIGGLLLLGIIVTFLSIMNALYIPSMKADAEVIHLDSVRNAFLSFSSDIENAIAEKRSMRISRVIELGGGDILINPLKSSGTIFVKIPSPGRQYLEIHTGTAEFTGNSVTFSYQPEGNFWMNQGYRWENGIINVSQGSSRETWLLSTNADSAREKINETAKTFIHVSAIANSTIPDQCSSITVSFVNLTPDKSHSFASGNGEGLFSLNSSIVSDIVQSDSLIVTVPLNNLLSAPVLTKVEGELKAIDETYGNINGFIADPVTRTVRVSIDNSHYPVSTIIEKNEIFISAL